MRCLRMASLRDEGDWGSFIGSAWSEDLLLAAGFAFEQQAKVKVTAQFLPSIDP